MARIAGIDIPKNKRGVISLTYIFGIGNSRASTILDLPHPFGPTIPVRPLSIKKFVLSKNDLNPESSSFLNSIFKEILKFPF